MKGFILSKTSITLILTLIMLSVFAPAVLNAADELVKRGVFVQAEQIAGLVNVMQASPSNTFHAFQLPKGECRLELNSLHVNLTMNRQTAIKDIVIAGSVAESSAACGEESKTVYVKKCRGRVLIEETQGCG